MAFDPSDPPVAAEAEPESIRRAYLRDESNVKSIGQLCYLVLFFSLLGTLEFVLFAVGVIPQPPEMKQVAPPELIRAAFWALTVIFSLNSVFQAVIGRALIRLRSWARWTIVVLTAMSLVVGSLLSLASCLARPVAGLVSFVVGLAFHGLILFPLLTPSVGFVFSPAYREVVRKTPEIRSRMHWLLKLLIGLILASVLAFLGFLLAIYLRVGWADWLFDRLI